MKKVNNISMRMILSCGFLFLTSGCSLTAYTYGSSFFPEIEMDIPDSVLEADARIRMPGARIGSLSVDVQANGPLGHLVERFEKSIGHANRMLARLNQDNIIEAGTFSGKGPDGDVSGKVEALTDDADGYDFEATVCQDGVVFQNVKWNEEVTKVLVYRDFNKNPLGVVEATNGTFIGRMIYDATDSAAVVAEWRSTGTPWRLPADIEATGDDSIVEYAQVIKDADGGYLVRGVNDWYTGAFPTTPDGQSYAVGYISADGSDGTGFGYRNTSSACASTVFNETTANWCLAHSFRTGTAISASGISSAWSVFILNYATTVPPEATLQQVSMPADLTCE